MITESKHGPSPETPGNLNSYIQRVRDMKRKDSRDTLVEERQLYFTAKVGIEKAGTGDLRESFEFTLKKQFDGITLSAVDIGLQKLALKEPLRDPEQEPKAKAESIKFVLGLLQSEKKFDAEAIRAAISEVGLEAVQEELINKLKDFIDASEENIKKAVEMVEDNIKYVLMYQRAVGVKDKKEDYDLKPQ